MKKTDLKRVAFEQAISAYRSSDRNRWRAALWCYQVVGGYEKGATIGLASDMNVSVDTVEWMAHAYDMWKKLCVLDRGYVFRARNAPYIYLSHFRALYDAQTRYDLSDNEVLSLLVDIVQSEGTLSSRNVDQHVMERMGKRKRWQYYAGRAAKELTKLQQHEDCPKKLRSSAEKMYKKLKDL